MTNITIGTKLAMQITLDQASTVSHATNGRIQYIFELGCYVDSREGGAWVSSETIAKILANPEPQQG